MDEKSGLKSILWMVQTAMFIALLITAQMVTQPMGQFVTGSSVNFILVVACILLGLPAAATVGVVSPALSFMITGRPPFLVLIPIIMLSNVVLVVAVHFIFAKNFMESNVFCYIRAVMAVVVGSVLKFLVLFFGIVQIALAFIPNIMPPQVTAMSHMFSWPQPVTALIGSALAMMVTPYLVRAVKGIRSR